MSSFRVSPGFPLLESACGSLDMEERYESREVSRAERAVERARACENAYRAGKVSIGRSGEVDV